MDDTTEKKKIRKTMLNKRNSMNIEEAESLSEIILSNVVKMSVFKKSKNIMLYLSFKNEVDTYRLISYCQEKGKKVIVPYTKKEENKMIPSLLEDIDNDLMISSLGYKEPKIESLRPVDAKDIDFVIVPGVAFDKRCYRIGFGGGYYDRFLPKLRSDAVTVGIAYDFQILERIPIESFDIPLNYIVTEKRIIVSTI